LNCLFGDIHRVIDFLQVDTVNNIERRHEFSPALASC
jgi:hypothetical protein